MRSIRKKILASFFIIVSLFSILGIYNQYTLYQSNKNAEEIANEQLPLLIAEENLNMIISNLIATAHGYLRYEDNFRDRFEKRLEEFELYANEALQLARGSDSEEELNRLIALNRQWNEEMVTKVLDVYDSGDAELAIQNLERINSSTQELVDGYVMLVENQENVINEMEQQVVSQGEKAINIGTAVMIVVLLISIVLAFLLAGTITKPIQQVMEQMKQIGAGKLNIPPLKVRSNDEIGQMAVAANDMHQSIKDTVANISQASNTMASHSEELMQSSNEVKSVSEQVAGTMQELASGSESQANHAVDISTSMENFIEKVEEASRNGDLIQTSSNEVIQMTEKGYNLMNRSEDQMGHIHSIVKDSVQKVKELDIHSQNISKFVSIIEDIASQTNLLALNASIEAARAGEQGRGFVVVAEEIRKLAEQSAASVTEIVDLVENIQKESETVTESLTSGYEEVQEGTARIQQTSETFDEIKNLMNQMIHHVEKNFSNLKQITRNSEEMSRSIQEIASVSEEASAGIEETSASTQQTMSSMEEVAASSEQLSKLAEELKMEVAKFKL